MWSSSAAKVLTSTSDPQYQLQQSLCYAVSSVTMKEFEPLCRCHWKKRQAVAESVAVLQQSFCEDEAPDMQRARGGLCVICRPGNARGSDIHKWGIRPRNQALFTELGTVAISHSPARGNFRHVLRNLWLFWPKSLIYCSHPYKLWLLLLLDYYYYNRGGNP